jgi:hypothetical protein
MPMSSSRAASATRSATKMTNRFERTGIELHEIKVKLPAKEWSRPHAVIDYMLAGHTAKKDSRSRCRCELLHAGRGDQSGCSTWCSR